MNNTPVYVFAKWQVKKGQLDAVLGLLTQVAKASTQEKGNLFYHIHQSHADDHTLILSEGYINEAAVEEHRHSNHFQQLVIGEIVPMLENREVILAARVI